MQKLSFTRSNMAGLLVVSLIVGLGGVLPLSPTQAQECLSTGDVTSDEVLSSADARLALQLFLEDGERDPCLETRANGLTPVTSGLTPGDVLCLLQHFLVQSSCLDPPLVYAQRLTMSEDTPLEVAFSGVGVERSILTFTMVMPPAQGSLNGTPPLLMYTPDANFVGIDAFMVVANDGTADSEPVPITIDVTPVNDPPVAESHTLATPEDTPLGVMLSGSSVERDGLTFTVVRLPTHGNLSGTPPVPPVPATQSRVTP